MTEVTKRKGRWKPGESGNPAGRKPGNGKIAALRASIAEHLPEVIQQMVLKAKDGDVQAAKLLLDRVIPSLKSAEQPMELTLPQGAGLAEKGESIIKAVANGSLAPSQGGSLLTSLGAMVRIKEFEELEQRLTALEEQNVSEK